MTAAGMPWVSAAKQLNLEERNRLMGKNEKTPSHYRLTIVEYNIEDYD